MPSEVAKRKPPPLLFWISFWNQTSGSSYLQLLESSSNSRGTGLGKLARRRPALSSNRRGLCLKIIQLLQHLASSSPPSRSNNLSLFLFQLSVSFPFSSVQLLRSISQNFKRLVGKERQLLLLLYSSLFSLFSYLKLSSDQQSPA